MAEPDRASTRSASAPDAFAGDGADPAPAAPDGPRVPDVPRELAAAAAALFGARLPLAVRYAGLLVGDGVERGLIGPREAPRIWDRHLLNCAALTELLPDGAYVVDVGSGAGLPGIVLAVARPDLRVVLVDSLARRTLFLSEAVAELGLDRVEVVRARAEECAGTVPPADAVTARAVAPLDRLAAWCLPLARPGGAMLAIKGSSAGDEVLAHRAAILRAGGSEPAVRRCGVGLLAEPVTVVEVRRAGAGGGGPGRAGAARGGGARGAARGGGARGAARGGSGGAGGGGGARGGDGRGRGSRAPDRDGTRDRERDEARDRGSDGPTSRRSDPRA